MMQRYRLKQTGYQLKEKMRKRWPLLIFGLFFWVVGVLMGIKTAGYFEGSRDRMLLLLLGIHAGRNFWGNFLHCNLRRFGGALLAVLFSGYPLMFPLSVLTIIMSGGIWSLPWGLVFMDAGAGKMIILLPLFLLVFLMHGAPQVVIFERVARYMRKTFRDRGVAKSSQDVTREAVSHYIGCTKWFLLSILASLLEALILPIFL